MKNMPTGSRKWKLTFLRSLTLPSKPLTLEFGPHGNWTCFSKGLSIKRIKLVEKLWIYQFGSVHFFVDDSSTEATELARKSPKFP
jgi:hypothetical protein